MNYGFVLRFTGVQRHKYTKGVTFMKKLTSILAALFLASALSAQTVAVWGFDSDTFCLENKTAVMSDLLIDELVGINGITVVERNRLDDVIRELDFQNGIYTDPQSVKSVGKMVNADCVITGNTTIIDGDLLVTARLIEVETAKILYTSKMQCSTWKEFYQKLPKFAQECVNKIPSPNRFLGKWICDLDDESYEITFKGNKTCEITTSSEAMSGTYSYGKDKYSGGDMLKVNARAKSSKSKIAWSSLCTFTSDDYSSFNIQIKNSENKTIRASFVKVE